MHQSQTASLSNLGKNKLWQLITTVEGGSLYHYTLLGLIFLAAAVLRLHKLGDWSFWIDEIYSLEAVGTSQQLLAPISTWLMRLSVQQFGISEWSMRLAPALFGLLTLPLMYVLVKKLFDRCVALIAVTLLAISPWHVYWSQNARFYTTLLLFYLVALLAFFWSVEERKRWLLLLSLVFLALALFERMFAAFLVPVIIGYIVLLNALAFEKHSFLRYRKLLSMIAIPVVIFLLYDSLLISSAGESRIVSFLVKFVGNPNKTPPRFLASFVYHVGLPILCLGTTAGLYLIARKERVGLYLLTAAVLPPLALTLASPFIFTADRYALISLPSWIILSAVGVRFSLVQGLRYGLRHSQVFMLVVPLIVVADSLVANTLYYQYQNGNRPDWRGAFSVVEAQLQDGDVVFSTRPEIGAYYLEQEVTGIDDMDTTAVSQYPHRTWFVVNLEETDPGLQAWLETNGELIEVIDVYIPGNVISLRVYRYGDAIKT